MSVSGIESRASLASSLSSQTASGSGQELRAAMKALREALNGDDLNAATEAYDTVMQVVEEQETRTSRQPPDGLTDMLSTVGAALEDGDLEAARSAFLRGASEEMPTTATSTSSSGVPSDAVREAMGGLSEALQGDDVQAAQDAYDSLLAVLEDERAGLSDDAAAAPERLAFEDRLEDMGTALSVGSLQAARMEFADLAPRGAQGIDIVA